MCRIKFILFIGLFWLCETVVHAAELNKPIDVINRIYPIKLVGDDNIPRLNCSIESSDGTLGLGDNDIYLEVLTSVKAYRVTDVQPQFTLKTENIQSPKNIGSRDEIGGLLKISSEKLEAEPSLLPYYEFDKGSILRYAKRLSLIFEEWPSDNSQTIKGYFYKINYKIWKLDPNSSRKNYLANFNLKVLCYRDAVNTPIAGISTDSDGKYNEEVLNNIEFRPKNPETGINSFRIMLENKDKSETLQRIPKVGLKSIQ